MAKPEITSGDWDSVAFSWPSPLSSLMLMLLTEIACTSKLCEAETEAPAALDTVAVMVLSPLARACKACVGTEILQLPLAPTVAV